MKRQPITVRPSDTEREELTRGARLEGIPLATYARRLLVEANRVRLADTDRLAAELQERLSRSEKEAT